VSIDKDDIVHLCLDVLDDIITTHTDTKNLKRMALKGIRRILLKANADYKNYGEEHEDKRI